MQRLLQPAPTVWAACESVPVVIRRPPRSAYQRTTAGPGMLVFGVCRRPEVLISKPMPRSIIASKIGARRSR